MCSITICMNALPMTEKKRLGLPPHIYCRPLTDGLAGNMFTLLENPGAHNAILLRQGDLDAAFLSPIEYAREGSAYRIVPGIAISSSVASGAAVLFFRETLHAITTLAVDPAATSEIVLARILLGEQFDACPQIVPTFGSLNEMLTKADAALVVGNAALSPQNEKQHTIDLVEEWFEMTGLPYVHGFWCGRENALSKEEIGTLKHAQVKGAVSLHAIAQKTPGMPPYGVEEYLEHFTYDFPDDTQDALMEFLRYAYYHGILPDVPDLEFYSFDTETDPPAALTLLN